eukprot:Pompholyxophrys_punicea_v1_NODE_191_length_2874_cov_15.987230.p2 type:complete len:210 gc:universal NODE_191_length_2874_cov_15.987230:1957-1328(-)
MIMQVLFSDEKKFMLFRNDGRVWVRRRQGEAYDPRCVRPTVKHGGGSLMFWACFSAQGPGNIVRVAKDHKFVKEDYLDILRNHMIPSAFGMGFGDQFTFLQDNDPKHTAKIVKDWLANPTDLHAAYPEVEKIHTIAHPAQSPDLNALENLWDYVEKKVQARKPTTLKELEQYVMEEWSRLPADLCRHYALSMPRRLAAVIKNKGYATKY